MTTQSPSYTRSPAGVAPPDLPRPAVILGRAGQENFKVASRLLAPAARDHLMAFYGFARLVDYLGDEYPGDRPAALAWVESETRRALAGGGDDLDPLVGAGAAAVLRLGLDPAPLFDLIAANVADQTVTRYPTFGDLLGYCRLSANPVGHLVLGAFGYRDEPRRAWSDSICTGLQLAEHWQDVAEDARAGRIYLPEEDLDRFGVSGAELSAAGRAGPHWRALMVFEVSRARRHLDEGQPLIASLRGPARVAVAGFWAGGHAALDAVAARRYDVTGPTPRPTAGRVLLHVARAMTGGRR